MAPREPTPHGTFRKSALIRSATRSRMSSWVRLLAMSRTPQLMSYPTPPGETTPPADGSVAATPPMGKP